MQHRHTDMLSGIDIVAGTSNIQFDVDIRYHSQIQFPPLPQVPVISSTSITIRNQ
jgi:hypothetical protein